MAKFMKLDDKYSVSIVMPTYNRKELVAKNIEKLLNEQDYDPTKFEIIVVDDGSKDGTYDFLSSKFKKEIGMGRLKVLTQKNHGLSRARNHGLKYAKGKYICRMDDDDSPLANRLKESINYFKKNPNKRLVHAKSYWVDKKGKKLHNGKNFVRGLNKNRENIAAHGNLENKTEDYLLSKKHGKFEAGRNVIHGGTTMAHRSLYEDIEKEYGHVYDPAVVTGEDRDLWVRIAKMVKEKKSKSEIGFLNKIIANYTFTPEQMKKQKAKIAKRKDIDGYLNSKLNNKQKVHIIFANNDIKDNTKLRHYLHKVGRRAYRNGNLVKFVFRDSDSKQYRVRSLDTDVVRKRKDDFFNTRTYDINSFAELQKEINLNSIDSMEFVDGTHFTSEHRKISKIPFQYTITENLKKKDLSKLSNSSRTKKRLDLLVNSDKIVIHTENNKKLEQLLLTYVDKKKINRWEIRK